MDKLIDRKLIQLNPAQEKMLISGWGNNALSKSVVEEITYLSDGLKVKGYLARPSEAGKKYPCLIWNRGGFGKKGVIDSFNAMGMFGLMASWGYVVFASHYRGNAGGEGEDEFGGSDVNDILNLIPLAEEIEEADTTKWGIEGWSRGGMMTYLALTKTDIFKAAIISGGISNLHCNAKDSRFMRYLYEDSFGIFDSDKFKERCTSRSIINFPEKLSKNTPLLLLHGTNDERVSPKDSLEISQKLLDLKISFRLMLFEGGDHFLKTHRKEVEEIKKNWFAKYLK